MIIIGRRAEISSLVCSNSLFLLRKIQAPAGLWSLARAPLTCELSGQSGKYGVNRSFNREWKLYRSDFDKEENYDW